jgi:hypothetical protein
VAKPGDVAVITAWPGTKPVWKLVVPVKFPELMVSESLTLSTLTFEDSRRTCVSETALAGKPVES